MKEDNFDISRCAQLDRIVLDELNVKELSRPVCVADGRQVCLVFGKEGYRFEMDGIPLLERTNARLFERGVAEQVLRAAYPGGED